MYINNNKGLIFFFYKFICFGRRWGKYKMNLLNVLVNLIILRILFTSLNFMFFELIFGEK